MPFFSRDSRLKTFLKKVNDPQHSEVDRWQSYESVEDEDDYTVNDAENKRRSEEEGEEQDNLDLDYQQRVMGGGNKVQKYVNMYLTDLIFFYENRETTIAEYKKILKECAKNCDYYKKAIRIINNRFNHRENDRLYYEKWFRDGYKDDYKRWDYFKAETDIIQFYNELGKIQKDSNEESAAPLEQEPLEGETTVAGGNRSHKKRKHKRTHKKRKNKRTRITRKNKRQRKTRRKI